MSQALHLFEAFGVELEYMLVDRDTLDVRPITDEILKAIAGSYESEIERGVLCWSNELVLHVIELKTNGPMGFADLSRSFADDVREINKLAAAHNALLMPSAMHPWMNPKIEMKLWPHEYSPVYESFDRIFGCEGHGWSNLQSTHLNLPFNGDDEFGRLHAAIRLILPILPALAASSPIVEGAFSPQFDARLEYYRHNARKLPLVSGRVIPEPAYTAQAYDEMIFQPLYRAIAPHDPDGILQYEWLNARGAIARFDRGAIEIRLLDVQECPAADLAIVQLIVAVLEDLVSERWSTFEQQAAMSVDALQPILLSCIEDADEAAINDTAYLKLFGYQSGGPVAAAALWRYLCNMALESRPHLVEPLRPAREIFRHGCLSRRIRRAVGPQPSRERIAKVYRRLCDCLANNEMFIGPVV